MGVFNLCQPYFILSHLTRLEVYGKKIRKEDTRRGGGKSLLDGLGNYLCQLHDLKILSAPTELGALLIEHNRPRSASLVVNKRSGNQLYNTIDGQVKPISQRFWQGVSSSIGIIV